MKNYFQTFLLILFCFVLFSCSKPTGISGIVYDNNNQPLQEVEISINGTVHATTDAYGFFEIIDLKEGNYNLEVAKLSYSKSSQIAGVWKNKMTTVNFTLAKLLMSVISPTSYSISLTGEKLEILWTCNVTGTLKIELYKAEILNLSIENSTENDGSYLWTIPTTLNSGANYKIKIISNDDLTVYDESDYFTINTDFLSVLTTLEASNITTTTATCGGNVSSDGGSAITQRGICYSTSQNPTILNNIVTATGTTGTFTCNLTDLNSNTTYYVKSFATNNVGTGYGEQISFITNSNTLLIPVLTTSETNNITTTTATCGGNVSSDGGSNITQRGICYSTIQNPTILNNIVTAIGTTGTFTCNLTDLNSNTTYYVKSFATNNIGTGYGVQKSFVTASLISDIWIMKSDFTGGNREDAVSFVLNNEAYVFGGFDGLNIHNDTWKYNPNNDTWQQVGTAGVSQSGRKGAVAFVIDEKAWVGLGVTDLINNNIDSSFVYYTSSTNSWRQKYSEFPIQLKDAIGFTLQVGTDQRGFVGFGKNEYGIENGDLYMYLQEADTAGSRLAWIQVTINGQSPSARAGATVTVIENKAFICCGEDNGIYKNDLWMFDGVSQFPNGTWQKLADFPGAARSNAVSFSLEYTKLSIDYKVIYVGTGVSNSGLLLNDYWSYDLASQTWMEISLLGAPNIIAVPRESAVGFDINGSEQSNSGYICTGKIGNSNVVNELFEYHP
jgi:N-acetylneuraminic acid mutarotase